MSRQQILGTMAASALAALLCLPLAAQTAAATAAQPAAVAQNAPAPAQAEAPLVPPVRQGFWGRLNPFARKKYVEGQLAPIRDRANELDGLTADNSRAIGDVDARAKAGISAANDRAQQADDTANAAQQQVQQDSTQAAQLDGQVTAANTKLQSVDQYQLAQSVELHFRPGPAKLSADTQQQLDGFLQGLDTQKGYVVEVTAYSTRKGAAGVAASQQLAAAVVRYLVLQHNVPLYRIYTMGMGDAQPVQATSVDPTASGARARPTAGGTVQIKILKNSLAASAPAQP